MPTWCSDQYTMMYMACTGRRCSGATACEFISLKSGVEAESMRNMATGKWKACTKLPIEPTESDGEKISAHCTVSQLLTSKASHSLGRKKIHVIFLRIFVRMLISLQHS